MARAAARTVSLSLSLSLGLSLRPTLALADDDSGEITAHPVAALEGSDSLLEKLAPANASGFVLANGAIQSVPSAVPRNQTDYNLTSVFGISAAGHPFEKWEYRAFITANVSTSALNGTGGGFSPEYIAFTYHPTDTVRIEGGYIRIPFSVGQSTVITNSMFPTRPQPTELFQGGADAGLLASYETLEGRLRAKVGVFDGLSLNTSVPNHTTRGPVGSIATEISPLGGMPGIEGEYKDSPFRFALAAGAIYRSGTAYDPRGYEGLGVKDVGIALAARFSLHGLYGQAEYLQDVRTDDLSGRPHLTRGAYGETSYHVRVRRRVGLSPMFRLGWSEGDAEFYPLHIVTGNAGLALYPRGDLADRGSVRIIIEYQSERRIEEGETGYGVIASVLARF